MGFHLVRFDYEGQTHWGTRREGYVRPLDEPPTSFAELMSHGLEAARASSQARHTIPADNVRWHAPVVGPMRVVCQGLNYATHRTESGVADRPSGNTMFYKDESAIIGGHDLVVRPPDCRCLDYEVELGLVLRRAIDRPLDITKANWTDYVGGWILANDLSPRDLQYRDDFAQWFKGKSCRSMLPLGPSLFVPDPEDWEQFDRLELKLWINDDLRQRATARQMLFHPAETLREISTFMNMAAGDLLLTGTPGGVVVKAPSKFKLGLATWLMSNEQKIATLRKKQDQYLQDGDRIRAQIKTPDGQIDLGTQENVVVPYESENLLVS